MIIIIASGGGAVVIAVVLTVVICKFYKNKGDRGKKYEMNDTKDISKSEVDLPNL